MLHVSRFFVWLTRQLLKGLMHVALLLSSALSRQMEFNADSHAYGRVGHEAFSESMRNLAVIQLANAWAYNDLNAAWSAGRLGDDLVALIEDNLGQLEDQHRSQAIEESLASTGIAVESALGFEPLPPRE